MLISTAQYTHCHKAALHTAILRGLVLSNVGSTLQTQVPISLPYLSLLTTLALKLRPLLASGAQALLLLFQFVYRCFCLFVSSSLPAFNCWVCQCPKSLSLAPTSPLSYRSASQHFASFLHLVVARSLKLTM